VEVKIQAVSPESKVSAVAERDNKDTAAPVNIFLIIEVPLNFV
jgi:hypothetical protein